MQITFPKPNNSALATLLTFFSPIAGLYLSIRYNRQKWAKNIFWVWCAFMGLVFIYDPGGGSRADSIRVAAQFVEFHNSEITVDMLLKSFYAYDEVTGRDRFDLYFPVINFFVSRFTGNPRWIFFFYALIFGFFYSRNIWYIIENIKRKPTWSIIIVLFAFATTSSIWNIGGPRIWTAVQVFLFGLLPYISHGDKSKLIWCYLSILFHFSFLVFAALLTLYFLLPRPVSVYFIFYLIAQTISELNMELINSLLKSVGFSVFDAKIDEYANEDYLLQRQDSISKYSVYYFFQSSLFKYPILVFNMITYYFLVRVKNLDKKIQNMFCFVLYFSAFALIFEHIPSGGRFIALSNMLALSTFIRCWYDLNNRNFNRLLSFFSGFMIIYCITRMRLFAGCFGFDLFYQNFISVFFVENNSPIYPY